MITKIEVDGFKSLGKFDLQLKKGLNILVGPNGAGKTNIILFFEFLSNLISNQVGHAISSVGGAGSIFEKKGADDFRDNIIAKIYGCYHLKGKTYVAYEYFFEINISFEQDVVFYASQRIKARSTTKFWESPDLPHYPKKWDLDIQFQGSEGRPELVIHSFNNNKIKERFFGKLGMAKIRNFLVHFIARESPSHHSLVRCVSPFASEYLRPLLLDLKGGETFNIIPSRVRELEDSATPPIIKKDGSGLATTLYAMKKSKSTPDMRGTGIWRLDEDPPIYYNPETLDRIVTFLKAANSSIQSLDVENDPFSNKLRVKVTVASGDYDAILPLAAMSDGTIKWLTLITAILTSKTIFSIEEPENFLHPWMQAEIASIMRNHLEEKENPAFVLMTTHSESLLNYAKPEEIITVDLWDGRSKARRLKNVAAIREEISNSGFGLGHFYFSNALTNE